jgi:hypothetical protein
MNKKYNFFNSQEFENLIPYLVMIAVGVATFYIIQVCVNLM